jgi:hypothetical protein
VHDLDQTNVIFDWAGVLKPEKDRRPVGVAGGVDVVRPLPLHDEIGIGLEPAVPRLEVQHRLSKILVIGDGHVDRSNTAFAHLPEYLFRPVGILQPINAQGGRILHQRGTPEMIEAVFTVV